MSAAEPREAVLSLDGDEVGRIVLTTEQGANRTGEQITVTLDQAYDVKCDVTGGNPPPNVTLTSGVRPLPGVRVVQTTERDENKMMSVPEHTREANVQWTPKVDDIARKFVCSSGVENPRAVSVSFIPIVDNSK